MIGKVVHGESSGPAGWHGVVRSPRVDQANQYGAGFVGIV